MKDPFVVFSLSVVGGTVAIIGFLVFKAVTGDFSCSKGYVDGYVANTTCCYNGHCANVPLSRPPGAAR